MRWLIRLMVLGLAIGAIREIRDRQQTLVAIGQDLTDQRRGIQTAETDLDGTERSLDDAESRVRELDGRITAMERDHPRGIPASIKPDYLQLLQERNDAVALYNDLVGRQRRVNDEYKAQVDHHNARVADANAYAAAIGPCSFLPGWIRTRVCAETD